MNIYRKKNFNYSIFRLTWDCCLYPGTGDITSTFLIHLPTISTSCSPIYGLQPISLILLTSSTTLSMVTTLTGANYGICVVGVACVVESTIPFITALTIWTRILESTYCGGTLVGIVNAWASVLSYCPTASWGTSSVWLGIPPSPVTAIISHKASYDLTVIQGIFVLPTLGISAPAPPF